MTKRRVLSSLLVLCMMMTLLPGTVFAEEPLYEEPAYEEPAIEELPYEEPAYVEPTIEEPSYEEPAVEEPAYEEPAYEEPAYEEPVIEEPPYEEPAYVVSTIEEPAYVEPTIEEPAYEEPAYEEPAAEEPSYEEPPYEEPAIEEPAYEEPAAEEPSYEEPPYEEPAAEEPENEEPAEQATAIEEPAEEEEIIADAASAQTASEEAALSGAPVISGQPESVTAEAGNDVYFNVWTYDEAYYEWEVRENSSSAWHAYTGDGCTDYEIVFTAEYSMNGWQFRCKVSNDMGSVYSDAATLTVYVDPPEINDYYGPSDAEVTEGDDAYFSVVADGYDLSYQWQVRKNSNSSWINSGAEGNKTSELRVTAALSLNGYQYRCAVSNPVGTVYSYTANLKVVEMELVSSWSGDQQVYLGDRVEFWVRTPWNYDPASYQWQVRKDADSGWSNSGLPSAASSDLEFTPDYSLNGYQYRCAVTFNGITKYSEPMTLTVLLHEPNFWDTTLYDAYTAEGTSVSLHVAAQGDLLSYQWQVRKNSSSDWVNSGAAGSKTDTLTLTPGYSLNGYQYRLGAKNDAGTAYSNAATLHVIPKPKITAQPASVTVGNDVKTDFSVGVEGYDREYNYDWNSPYFSFQWQVRKNSSSNWGKSSIASATSDTLTVTAGSALNGYQYRCVVTRREEVWDELECTNRIITTTAVSSPATLTVVNLLDPTFTQHPSDTSVYEGDKASFTVGVTDSSLGYQWQVRSRSTGWVNSGIASAKTANLSFTVGTNHSGNEYRCAILSGTTVVGYSRAASLYVYGMEKPYPNYYNEEYEDYCVYAGDGVAASIHASFRGGGISSYQWQVRKDSSSNWGNSSLASAKTDTLTITPSMAMEGYQYRCIAKNAKGSGMCEAITLHVLPKPKITAQPASVTVGEGLGVSFKVGIDEENNGEWSNYTDFEFQWQVRKNSSSGWVNSGASGNQSDTLTVTASSVLNGYQYRCVVKKTVDNWGYDVHVTTTAVSSAATLTVLPKPTFTRQPENAYVYEGDKVSFSVGVSDSSLSYQWQVYNESTGEWVNSGIASAKTANLSFTVNLSHNYNQYRCVIKSGTAIVAYSEVAELEVDAMESPSEVQHPNYTSDYYVVEGEVVSIDVDIYGGGISYQWQVRKNSDSDWVNSGASGAKTASITLTASNSLNGYQYRCIARNLKGTATSSIKTLHVITKAKITSQPKSVSVTEGTAIQFSVMVEGYDKEDNYSWNDVWYSFQWQVRKNSSSAWSNSGIASAKTDTLTLTPSLSLNGYQYRCIVTKTESSSETDWTDITTKATSSTATLTVFRKPEITAQPKSVTVNEGTATSFSVAASGTGLSYQWQVRKNSSASWANSGAAGNKTSTLNVTASSSLAGYQYRCQVKTSEGGIAYSSAATLNVVVKPRIVTQPASTSVYAQEIAWFAVEASGTNPTYQWQVRKNSSASWSNSGAAGAKTDTLSVTASTTLNGYQYRCVIKNAAGTAVSAAATLTVKNMKASGWVEKNVKWTLDGGKLSVFLADGNPTTFTDWGNYKDYIYTAAWGEGLYGVGGFYNCKNLRSISLPSTLKSVNSGAFSGCSSLTGIKLPASLERIENSAFYACSALTSLSIPTSVNYLGRGAFEQCTGLVSVNIPARVTTIEDWTFSGCQSLSSISIPSGVTKIGANAFNNCALITAFNLPSGLKTIGERAFANCRSLQSISIPLGVTEIASNTFAYCYNLASVTLPTSITVIGNSAFYNTGLSSVKIPTHTVSLGDSAFASCYNLRVVSIPKSLTSIGNYAFNGCQLASVRYQGSMEDFGRISLGSGNENLRSASFQYNTY